MSDEQKLRRVVFYLGVGYPSCDRHETMEYPADTPESVIESDVSEWAHNYLDISFWDEEETED